MLLFPGVVVVLPKSNIVGHISKVAGCWPLVLIKVTVLIYTVFIFD